jgi:hypothetical protein
MFKKLLEWLNTPSLQSQLDAFILSKNPTTVAEVEYWIQYFDTHTNKGWVI